MASAFCSYMSKDSILVNFMYIYLFKVTLGSVKSGVMLLAYQNKQKTVFSSGSCVFVNTCGHVLQDQLKWNFLAKSRSWCKLKCKYKMRDQIFAANMPTLSDRIAESVALIL